ncbi:MAG: anti-phage ZorAB system protein ZorA, partial [Oceanobacter sp.]
ALVWQEFNKTLIEVRERDQLKLCNVYDADYFFNAASLAPGITESRLMAAVPGFLTAIGVIGTFVGLQLGLSELNIGNDAAVEEMKAGLAHVISGAKLAFMTSVWGVALSVAFNFIEKWLENGVRKRIGNLRNRIDKIFPRLTAEVQLQQIANDGGESREALQGLAERIGEKMQESLLQVTGQIQHGIEQSLQNVMGPAMDKLVADASDGSQRALEQLIESFMDKFGQQGAAQRESMDSASKGVSDAVESMNQALNGFISNLNQNQQAASEREQGLIRHISEQVDALVARTSEYQSKIGTAAEEQLKNFDELFEKQARTSASIQNGFTNKVKEQIAGMAENNREQQQQFITSTQAQMQALQNAFNQNQASSGQREQELVGHISRQVDSLVAHAQQQADKITQATGSQLSTMGEMIQSAQQKQTERDSALGQQFESTIADIKTSMQQQIEATQSLISSGRQLQSDMAGNSQNLQKLASSILDGANELTRSTTALKEHGATLQQASTKLSTSILSASESTSKLAAENQKAAEDTRVIRDQIQSSISTMERTVRDLNQMVNLADTSFQSLQQHQNSYLATLKENIQELADQGAKLLSDYAEQANGQTKAHLQIWAQSANDYAEQMNSAARALSNVVDEIETKVGAR